MFKRSFFYRYLSPYAGRLALNVFLRLLSVVFNLGLIFGVTPFLSILFGQIEHVEKPANTVFSAEYMLNYLKYFLSQFMLDHGKYQTLTLIVVIISVLYILKNIFAYLALHSFVYIQNEVVQNLRTDIYKRYLILPLSFFTGQQKGDLLARVTTDVQAVNNNILAQIELVMVDIIMVVCMLLSLFFLSIPLSLFTFIILPPFVYLLSIFSKKLRKFAAGMQDDLGQLVSQTEESISGLKAIKAYNAQGYLTRKFEKRNWSLFQNTKATYYKIDFASPLSEFLGTIAIMGVLIFGGLLILGENASLSPEIFLTFLILLTQILNPTKNISNSLYLIRKGKASVRRIKDVLYADEKIIEKPDAKSKKDFKSEIRFQNVTFSYETPKIINESDNIKITRSHVLKINDLVLKKGIYYAVVGPSGAGKSTFVDLLARFYDCTAGQIWIDGQDIKDLRISDVRNLSAYVSQETLLFNDSIANNIAFGKADVSKEAIIAAAKIAHAHEFIMQTEKGYETEIGDAGMKLSGGQRQRLSIARAVLKNAPILILDEATSALDTESEKHVQEAIQKIAKRHTTIAIAHRLSTVQHADEILVFDKGEIVERGTHHELLDKNGLYANLCRMQQL